MPGEQFMRHYYGPSGYVSTEKKQRLAGGKLERIRKVLDELESQDGPQPEEQLEALNLIAAIVGDSREEVSDVTGPIS